VYVQEPLADRCVGLIAHHKPLLSPRLDLWTCIAAAGTLTDPD